MADSRARSLGFSLLIALIAPSFAICSCASSDADEAGSGGKGGAAGSAGADQTFAACSEFAKRYCDSAEDCCASSYGVYDPAGCRDAFEKQTCIPGAAAVKAGVSTFHSEAIEPCLAAYAAAHAICRTDWTGLVEVRKAIWSACKIITGNVNVGKGCSTSVTCAQPVGAATAVCTRSNCTVIEFLNEGNECPYPQGAVSTCAPGLYCTTAGPGVLGVCNRATPLGAPCANVPLNQECGLGNFCDSSELVCKKAVKDAGEPCTQHPECISFVCDGVQGVCSEAPALVSEQTCSGS